MVCLLRSNQVKLLKSAKKIALRNGILVEGGMKGSRHYFIRESGRDIR